MPASNLSPHRHKLQNRYHVKRFILYEPQFSKNHKKSEVNIKCVSIQRSASSGQKTDTHK